MSDLITYDDKIRLKSQNVSDKYKVTAEDMNEIKEVVNNNAQEGVSVGTEAPTDGRRVWFENSANLFDSSTLESKNYVGASSTTRVCSTQSIYIEPGTYTFSTNIDTSVYEFKTDVLVNPPISVSTERYIHNSGFGIANPRTITITRAGYFAILIRNKSNTDLNLATLKGFQYQLQNGSTAKTYEPYVEKSIKIDDEDFISMSDLVSVGVNQPGDGKRVWFKNSRNLIEPLMATATLNGVTCTNNGDGSFTLNGTATANTAFRINQSVYNGTDNLKSYNGTYTLSCNELENGLDLRIMQNSSWISVLVMMNSNTPVTGSVNTDNCFTYINVANNKSVNNLTIRPMLEKGSTATAFEPYVEPSINVDGEKWIDKVNDTGWIDITSYINTSNFAVRTGDAIKARRIGNIVYFKGEIYCNTALSSHNGNIMNGIPSIFRPTVQFSRCGVKYDLGVPYNIFIATNGNIVVSESQNISVTPDYKGYQLTNLSGYIVD